MTCCLTKKVFAQDCMMSYVCLFAFLTASMNYFPESHTVMTSLQVSFRPMPRAATEHLSCPKCPLQIFLRVLHSASKVQTDLSIELVYSVCKPVSTSMPGEVVSTPDPVPSGLLGGLYTHPILCLSFYSPLYYLAEQNIPISFNPQRIVNCGDFKKNKL